VTSSSTQARLSRRATGAKLVASLGVLGGAVAVAGMGTFGTFTDSSTPVDTSVATGTVSIEIGPAAAQATVPLLPGGLLPGDSYITPLNLVNNGDLDLAEVRVQTTASQSSVMDTDKVNGLQVQLRSCAQDWTVVGAGYTCPGSVTDLYAGPIITDSPMPGAAALKAGGVDHLLAVVTLPQSAGNAFQSKTTGLNLTFTAAQRAGKAR
jgi:hypothetical protein